MKNILTPLIIIGFYIGAAAQWRTLEPGLEFAQFRSPSYKNDTTAQINVLRIDTKRYKLVLMNASHPNQGELMTAREWAKKEGLTAAVNAAMYQADYRRSVSHMKTSEHTNNSRVSKDKTVLFFEPLEKNIAPARIIDMDCDDFEKIRMQYGSAVQSIRMISCAGKNVWQESERRWSILSVGTDKSGRVLFIQSTAAHSVHEFINILQGLPISIDRAMYMEGGSPSQMYIGTAKETHEFIGDFSAGGKAAAASTLPNVLGIRPVK
ncbi:MAG: phosphodiester glycosidase family protein [Chitinispirillia bacterium]|nr:phosphodiester glycosidase family protein [Chitinispirillia bacterium]MCL2268951.1 phosphodiester glycosidase family protein [Chitinispirillia bacterium]